MTAVVLEARDRVGGRVWTRQLEDGTALDIGGTWLGPGQDAAYALAQELQVPTYPTYATGETVFVDAQGKVSAYRGSIPPIGPLPIVSLAQGMYRLDAMARSVPLEAPWTAKHARSWDARSVGSWLDTSVPTRTAKRLLAAAARGLLTADPSEVSLLQFLHVVRSARGGLNGLLAIEGGYQQDRLTGGAQSLANVMSQELGEAVHLSTPISEIEQHGDGVTVRGDTLTVRAKRTIIAIPPRLAGKLRYSPPLPADHAQLLDRMPAGEIIKIMTVYPEPFWRADGRSGQSVSMDSPIETTLDASPKSGRGVLASFAFGRHARALARLTPDDRKDLVLDTLRKRFGPKGGEPIAYEEADWEREEWTRGCSAAHLATGVLTQLGRYLRVPVGRIHWAGSELANKSWGTIDGAVRSGLRAADEVLAKS
ncbi:MAG TPA: FAD-dependent oxidoreductase [Dehalococcoidia bacterium]|nr:FAD-dependent oxidoreductase [Dehalococcoidia bacterium]